MLKGYITKEGRILKKLIINKKKINLQYYKDII